MGTPLAERYCPFVSSSSSSPFFSTRVHEEASFAEMIRHFVLWEIRLTLYYGREGEGNVGNLGQTKKYV
jgi:hypothetical protein